MVYLEDYKTLYENKIKVLIFVNYYYRLNKYIYSCI